MNKEFAVTLGAVETDSTRKSFYPTPDAVAEKLLEGIDWRMFERVLEPSAGKGDLARYAALQKYYSIYRNPLYDRGVDVTQKAMKELDIDCIEIDPYLRGVLEDQGLRVVCDDFLKFETQKRYRYIIMNPPFDHGAAHLLHALELLQNGGEVRCILNAETLRNGYTEERQRLLRLLGDDAEITFMSGAFADAERPTGVDIALVRKVIPTKAVDSTIVEMMREAPTYKTQEVPPAYAEIVRYNQIDEIVNRYNFEVACGIKLMEEYKALQSYVGVLKAGGDDGLYLTMHVHTYGGQNDRGNSDINGYIRQVRGKYWRAVFQQPMFTKALTTNLRRDLEDMVGKLVDYDFSAYNILTLLVKMNGRVVSGIEDTIMTLFDKWTQCHWNEESPNRHYYNGWKTNDCFAIGKKVILPMYNAFDRWFGTEFRAYNVQDTMRDIEKVFDFLDSGRTNWAGSLDEALKEAEKTGNTKNLDLKYFKATFYKKGTCHLVFKDMDLLEKFNLFAGQQKGWLPPSYGKKSYTEMDAEERAVVDSFQGRERYEQVMARADYFLSGTGASTMPLLMGS